MKAKDNVVLTKLIYRRKGEAEQIAVMRQEGLGIRANSDDRDADIMLQRTLASVADTFYFEATGTTGHNALLDQPTT